MSYSLSANNEFSYQVYTNENLTLYPGDPVAGCALIVDAVYDSEVLDWEEIFKTRTPIVYFIPFILYEDRDPAQYMRGDFINASNASITPISNFGNKRCEYAFLLNTTPNGDWQFNMGVYAIFNPTKVDDVYLISADEDISTDLVTNDFIAKIAPVKYNEIIREIS